MLDEETLEDVFNDDQQGVLLKTGQDKRTPVIGDLLHHSAERGYGAIYVATERPYVTVKEQLDSTDHVYFIDCVVKTLVTQHIADQERVTLLPSSQNIQDLLAAIPAAYKSLPHDRVILITESLSALIAYNRAEPVEQFFQSLQEQVTTLDLHPILIEANDLLEDDFGYDLSGIVENILEVNA